MVIEEKRGLFMDIPNHINDLLKIVIVTVEKHFSEFGEKDLLMLSQYIGLLKDKVSTGFVDNDEDT